MNKLLKVYNVEENMFGAPEFAAMMLDLERISRASVDALFAVGCLQYELTMNQLHILLELNKGQAYTVGELSHMVGILKGNMAGVSKRLEERGLIMRKRSAEDERMVLLQITDAGKRIVNDIFEQIEQKHSAAFRQEASEEFEKILEGLKALYALLEQI